MPTKQTIRHLIDIKDENWNYASELSDEMGIDSVTNVINILLKEAREHRQEAQN